MKFNCWMLPNTAERAANFTRECGAQVLKRMALRLAGAALLVLSGCLAIAWLAGWSGGNETHFFVPAAALQGNAQPYLANMAGPHFYFGINLWLITEDD